MKTICLLLISFVGQAQTADSISKIENGPVEFLVIIDAKGSKDELYSKAKIWFADVFKNANAAIQAEDKEEGFLIGKGRLDYPYDEYSVKKKKIEKGSYQTFDKADFTIKVFTKDSKVKVTLTDIKLVLETLAGNIAIPYDTSLINNTKRNLTSAKLNYQAGALSDASRIENINKRINLLIESLKVVLNKKAENDF